MKLGYFKCLRQEVSQDFSVFSVLIPASGGSFFWLSAQKDHYPTSCIDGIEDLLTLVPQNLFMKHNILSALTPHELPGKVGSQCKISLRFQNGVHLMT